MIKLHMYYVGLFWAIAVVGLLSLHVSKGTVRNHVLRTLRSIFVLQQNQEGSH
jgi:hypothetical protein